jgi:hypothetical protein
MDENGQPLEPHAQGQSQDRKALSRISSSQAAGSDRRPGTVTGRPLNNENTTATAMRSAANSRAGGARIAVGNSLPVAFIQQSGRVVSAAVPTGQSGRSHVPASAPTTSTSSTHSQRTQSGSTANTTPLLAPSQSSLGQGNARFAIFCDNPPLSSSFSSSAGSGGVANANNEEPMSLAENPHWKHLAPDAVRRKENDGKWQ